MKNIQILVKKIRILHNDEDIEVARKTIENHINNGWKIKSSNMLESEGNLYIYTLLEKE